MSIPPTFLSQVFTRQLFAFAGHSLLIYDYLLTLSLEITYIWNTPWSLVKAVFLINRYGNLVGQTFIMLEETGFLSHGSRHFCIAFQLFTISFSVFSGESIRFLTVVRACAVLRCERPVAILLNTLHACIAVVIFALTYSYPTKDIKFDYLGEVDVCVSPVPPHVWLLWLIPLALDCVVYVFACRSLRKLAKDTHGYYPLRLVHLLAQDASMFYFASLFNVLFSIACWVIYGQSPLSVIQTFITLPFLTVIGQRVMLNLRRFGARSDSTRDLSREVDRQIAALADGHDQWGCEINGPSLEGENSIRMSAIHRPGDWEPEL